MGLVLECDGCEQKLDSDTAKKFGRIEPAYYCKDCSEKWDIYLEQDRATRIELLRAFAGWRETAKHLLSLKRFPDA